MLGPGRAVEVARGDEDAAPGQAVDGAAPRLPRGGPEVETGLRVVDAQAERTNAILTEIMLAQDFHDLTGQVIRKVVTLAQTVEEQLVKLLLETSPGEPSRKTEAAAVRPSLDGPVVKADGRGDVVTDQTQVDDLLASLGF